jgi:LPXTG-site transpeptidase (sortase) family protein
MGHVLRRTDRRLWAFAAGLLALGVVALGSVLMPAGSVTTAKVRRITYDPPKASAEAIAQGCPQLTNPGGKIDWSPSAHPDPVPTNGSVVIPSLEVQAPIVKVGIDATQRMVVPHNAREVAWLEQGGFPGKTNNMVLAGHIAYSGIAGSFNRIRDLRPGNLIAVTIGNQALTYKVVWNCSFSRDTGLANQIMGYTPTPSLTLISCGGVFDTAARTHTDRITVRAERVFAT